MSRSLAESRRAAQLKHAQENPRQEDLGRGSLSNLKTPQDLSDFLSKLYHEHPELYELSERVCFRLRNCNVTSLLGDLYEDIEIDCGVVLENAIFGICKRSNVNGLAALFKIIDTLAHKKKQKGRPRVNFLSEAMLRSKLAEGSDSDTLFQKARILPAQARVDIRKYLPDAPALEQHHVEKYDTSKKTASEIFKIRYLGQKMKPMVGENYAQLRAGMEASYAFQQARTAEHHGLFKIQQVDIPAQPTTPPFKMEQLPYQKCDPFQRDNQISFVEPPDPAKIPAAFAGRFRELLDVVPSAHHYFHVYDMYSGTSFTKILQRGAGVFARTRESTQFGRFEVCKNLTLDIPASVVIREIWCDILFPFPIEKQDHVSVLPWKYNPCGRIEVKTSLIRVRRTEQHVVERMAGLPDEYNFQLVMSGNIMLLLPVGRNGASVPYDRNHLAVALIIVPINAGHGCTIWRLQHFPYNLCIRIGESGVARLEHELDTRLHVRVQSRNLPLNYRMSGVFFSNPEDTLRLLVNQVVDRLKDPASVSKINEFGRWYGWITIAMNWDFANAIDNPNVPSNQRQTEEYKIANASQQQILQNKFLKLIERQLQSVLVFMNLEDLSRAEKDEFKSQFSVFEDAFEVLENSLLLPRHFSWYELFFNHTNTRAFVTFLEHSPSSRPFEAQSDVRDTKAPRVKIDPRIMNKTKYKGVFFDFKTQVDVCDGLLLECHGPTYVQNFKKEGVREFHKTVYLNNIAVPEIFNRFWTDLIIVCNHTILNVTHPVDPNLFNVSYVEIQIDFPYFGLVLCGEYVKYCVLRLECRQNVVFATVRNGLDHRDPATGEVRESLFLPHDNIWNAALEFTSLESGGTLLRRIDRYSNTHSIDRWIPKIIFSTATKDWCNRILRHVQEYRDGTDVDEFPIWNARVRNLGWQASSAGRRR